MVTTYSPERMRNHINKLSTSRKEILERKRKSKKARNLNVAILRIRIEYFRRFFLELEILLTSKSVEKNTQKQR